MTRLPRAAAADRTRPVPASFAQERPWLDHQLREQMGDPSAYNTLLAVRVGQLNFAALQNALDALVKRHEPLRTTFVWADGALFQGVRPPFVVELEIAGSSESGELALVLERTSKIAFDLDRGPLIRATLFRINGREHVLALTVHHIIVDGWSMDVLFRDLGHGPFFA